MPTHTSGAKSWMIFFASAVAVNMRTTVWALRARFLGVSFRWNPEMVMVAMGYPALATRRSSMPPLLPT